MKFTQVALYRKLSQVVGVFILLVIANSIILSATIDPIQAIQNSLYLYVIAVIAIVGAWLIAFLVTFVFAKAAELLSLEQEYFGEEKINLPSSAFNFLGSIFLFYTAFTSFNLDIAIFNVAFTYEQYLYYLLIVIAWIATLAIGLYYMMARIGGKSLAKLKGSLVLFAVISIGIFLIALVPQLSILPTYTSWNIIRIFASFLMLLIAICYTIKQKSEVASLLDSLKEKRSHRRELVYQQPKSKTSGRQELKISIILDKDLLARFLPNPDSFNMLHFAVSFSAFSFLIGMFMPALININAPAPFQLADLLIFGLFLISGAFTWITAIQLGSSIEPTEEKIYEKQQVKKPTGKVLKERPIYINTTSVLLSAFTDALLSFKGYLIFGMIGVFIFITLPQNLASLWKEIVGPFTFPVNYLVGFAAIVAAYIVGFGLSSLTEKVHSILLTLGILITLVIPLYFILALLYPLSPPFIKSIINLDAVYLITVTVMVFVAFTIGKKSSPLPIGEKAKVGKEALKILAPMSIESLPLLLTKNILKNISEIVKLKTVATLKQIYDYYDEKIPRGLLRKIRNFLLKFISRGYEKFDFIVMDAMSYMLLKAKYQKLFDYTAIRALGTSGNRLLIPVSVFLEILSKSDECRGLEKEEILKHQIKWIDYLLGRFDGGEFKELYKKLTKELINHFKYSELFVAIMGDNPPKRNELYYIHDYLIKKIIAKCFRRREVKNIHLIYVLPNQLASTAYFFDLVITSEPFATLLTKSRKYEIRCQERLSGIQCLPIKKTGGVDCSFFIDYYVFKSLFGRTPGTSDEVEDLGFYGANPTYLLVVRNDLLDNLKNLPKEVSINVLQKFLEQPNSPAFEEFKFLSFGKQKPVIYDKRTILAKIFIIAMDIWLSVLRSKFTGYPDIVALVTRMANDKKIPMDEKLNYANQLLSIELFKTLYSAFAQEFERVTGYKLIDKEFPKRYKTIERLLQNTISLINTKLALPQSEPEYCISAYDLFEIVSTQVLWSMKGFTPNHLSAPGIKLVARLNKDDKEGLLFSLARLTKDMMQKYRTMDKKYVTVKRTFAEYNKIVKNIEKLPQLKDVMDKLQEMMLLESRV